MSVMGTNEFVGHHEVFDWVMNFNLCNTVNNRCDWNVSLAQQPLLWY